MLKNEVIENIPVALATIKQYNSFKDFGDYTEFVSYKKGMFKEMFCSSGQEKLRKILQGLTDISPREITMLNDSFVYCTLCVLKLQGYDKCDSSKVVVSERYEKIDCEVTENISDIEKSLTYIIGLLSGQETKENVMNDLNTPYEMDIDLLVHFTKVEKVMKRIVTDKFRNVILNNKELTFNSDAVERIFNFKRLSISSEYLSGIEDEGVKNTIRGNYTVENLSGDKVFKFDSYIDKKDIMYKDFDDKNKAELYAYYTRTVKNFVSFCMRVIKQCYKNSSIYTIKKIEDVEAVVGCKLNLGVGDLEESITSTKLNSCVNRLCNDIYSRDKEFNKASMLGLVYLLSELVSKESVSIDTIKRGLF